MNVSRSTILIVCAVIAFVLGAVASEQATDVIFSGLTWTAIGGAFFAAAHLS